MSTPCPPNELLERILLGLTDDESAREFEEHASDCVACRRAMAESTAGDAWVTALAGARRLEAQPLAALLVPHLKRIPSQLQQTIAPAAVEHNAATSAWVHQPTKRTSERGATPRRDRLGPYELRGELGRGGMGAVLEAYDPRLQRSVAIKVLQSERFAGTEASERFLAEARAAAKVEHDHITPVFAVEMVDAAPCIVMPLLRGQTLQRRMEEAKGPLPLAEILRIGSETAAGLAAAHERGLVHRDIKPANLWLEEPNGRVKILDFGLALVRGDAAQGTGEIAGTPGFFAPEQARGEAVDARTDLFSLGCTLYLAATGKPPFSGPPNLRAMWTVLAEPPPPAVSLNPELPVELSDLIGRMLARRPADRPASAEEVRNQLEAIVRRPLELRQMKTRRRWIAALVGAAAASALSVAVWAAATMQTVHRPVAVTLRGEPAGLKVILERDGRETAADLGGGKQLELPPGDYFVRPATAEAGRALVPARFTVLPETPLTLQIAFVGEIAKHETHSQPVTGVVALGATERLQIISAGQDRVLAAWELAAKEPPRFVNLAHSARCLAAAPNGSEIATAGGNKFEPHALTVSRRRTADLELQGAPWTHRRIITAVAYSPDGTHLASATADGVFLWNLTTGAKTDLPESANPPPAAIAFSADGKRLITATNAGSITLREVPSGNVLKSIHVGDDALRAVVSLPNGFASAGNDGVVRVWNQTTFESQSLTGHQENIHSLAASADGQLLLSGDAGGALRVWSLPSGRAIHVLEGHRGPVNALAITANGRQAVSGGADNTVRLWQLPFP